MLIEEEEPKGSGDLNPDAIEGVFEEDLSVEEEIIFYSAGEDEEADELDMAFVEDEGHW